MFWNMKSCFRTWNHVEIMFYDLNMIWTWLHVPEHEIVFQNMIHVLKHRACFRNTISCSRTWNHVSEHDFMLKSCFMTWTRFEHQIMFQNMKSCSRTWFMFLNIEHVFETRFHVLEHEIMLWNMKSCSKLVLMSWTCYGHDSMFENMKSCSRTWNHVQIMFDSNRHVQDCACMFTACKSNHKPIM